MIRQFRFIIEDIVNNKAEFIINTIQLMVGLFIFCYVTGTLLDLNIIKNKINNITENTGVYMLWDNTPPKEFDDIINSEDKLPLIKQLYEYIEDVALDSMYIADSSRNFYFDDNFRLPKGVRSDKDNGHQADMLLVTPNFFSLFDIQKSFGENETEYDEAVPTIMGSKFRKVFDVGDIYYDSDGKAYIVKDFLDSNTYYVAPDESKDLINLDKFILMPITIDDDSDAIDYTATISECNFMADSDNVINAIIDKSNELGLYDFSSRNFTEQLDVIVTDTKDEIFVNATFMFIILIFACIGIIANAIQFISNYSREFAIHMLCGARSRDIIFRVFFQIIIMMLISLFAVCIIEGLSMAYLLTIVFAVMLSVVILIYPFHIIKRNSTNMLIKRGVD